MEFLLLVSELKGQLGLVQSTLVNGIISEHSVIIWGYVGTPTFFPLLSDFFVSFISQFLKGTSVSIQKPCTANPSASVPDPTPCASRTI